MRHGLRIERIYLRGATPHGSVPILSGYVGVCSCGQRSPLYGITAPVHLWYAQHLDPTGRRARATKGGVR